MKLIPLLALLLAASAPADRPRSYLLSINRMPLDPAESISAFHFDTWGVRFKAVCRIPGGWRMKAGGSATPEGELEGQGSLGATWFTTGSPKALQAFVLVTLHGPVQPEDIGSPGNGVPATFKGTVTISTDDGDVQRALSYKNVTLTQAQRCP